MKSIIIKQVICLLAFFLMVNFAFSQESKLWVRFDNTVFLPHVNSVGRLISTSEELNQLINDNGMTGFIQALPDSKSKNLQNIYEVSFFGNNEDVSISLSKLPFIGLVEKAPDYQVLYTPDDYNIALSINNDTIDQYALDLINAQAAWDLSHGSDSVVIAISDQNYYQHHVELEGKIAYYDSTNLATETHGTAVAILTAGNTNNGIGLSSIGFESKLALYQMTFNEILVASYAGADVINLSWTSGCYYTQTQQDVINEAYNNGSFIIAAAGNGTTCGGADSLVYPASYTNVFSVTSVGPTNNHERFIGDPSSTHQHNLAVDVSAPGYDVTISPSSNWYLNSSGTSWAAAYVTGTVGLMLSLNKCISNTDIELILKNSSQNIDSLNPLYAGKIGQGRLDAHEALVMTTAHLGDLTLSSALVDGCTANDVSISVSFVGGQAPHTLIWSNGANSLSLDSLGFGINQITITDAHGCSVNQVFNVVDVQEPILNSQVTNVACFGDSSGQIELLFTNPQEITNITWNNGQSGTVLSNLSVGTYEATISYNNGLCSIMQSELVQSPNVLSIAALIVDGCTANDVSISVSFVGGQAPHDVVWSNGANSLSLDSLGSGSNQITITDAHGCSVNQVFNVVDVQEPILNSQVTNVACFGDSSGQIELLFTNPQEITNITWNNGQSGTVLSNLSVGTYEATISYNNGLCSIMQSELVQSPNVLSIAALITDIDSINTGAIDVTVSGGTPPYLYNWDNNQQTEDLSNLIAGVYSISVTDSAGCSLAAFYEISEDTTGQSDGLDEVVYFNIHAYPNPSNGDVTISWSGELISLELISALGQVISKQYSFPTNTKLLKNLNSGVYFVRYTKNQTTSKTIKLVVL